MKKCKVSQKDNKLQSNTESDPSGKVMRVNDPEDISYLCARMHQAYYKPALNILGHAQYQRKVTRMVWDDAARHKQQFPYIGEVGFDMTKIPPEPLMSKNDPDRPTRWPISKYQVILKEYKENISGIDKEYYIDEVVWKNYITGKDELETFISKEIVDTLQAQGRVNPEEFALKKGKGIYRIPDVLKKKDPFLLGKQGLSQDNIERLIELKFPGDSLSKYQKIDYYKVVNDDYHRFQLLEYRDCESCDDEDREKAYAYEKAYQLATLKEKSDIYSYIPTAKDKEDLYAPVPARNVIPQYLRYSQFEQVSHEFGLVDTYIKEEYSIKVQYSEETKGSTPLRPHSRDEIKVPRRRITMTPLPSTSWVVRGLSFAGISVKLGSRAVPHPFVKIGGSFVGGLLLFGKDAYAKHFVKHEYPIQFDAQGATSFDIFFFNDYLEDQFNEQ